MVSQILSLVLFYYLKCFSVIEHKGTTVTVLPPESEEPVVPGRLSESLLAEGRLTPRLLEELRKEWLSQMKNPATLTMSDEVKNKNQHSPAVKSLKRKKKPDL